MGVRSAALREMRYRSLPRKSTRKPVIAVQKPAETQQNNTAKNAMVTISIGRVPWYGSTRDMNQVASAVCDSISSSSTPRRRLPAGWRSADASGALPPACGESAGQGSRMRVGRRSIQSRGRRSTDSLQRVTAFRVPHGCGVIDTRFSGGAMASRAWPFAACAVPGAASASRMRAATEP